MGQGMVSKQLLREADNFVSEAKDLLLQDNNGIRSSADINLVGRRSQDKKRLRDQLRIEKAKADGLKRGVLTVDMIKVEAKREVLSNDKVMRLGEERLQLRITTAKMSTKKFGEKELVIPNNERAHKFIMRTAWKSFPRLHQFIHREKDARPMRKKTEVVAIIGSYLRRAKDTAKNIVEFAYDKSGSDRTVPKREREWEAGDILWVFKFFRVGDEALDSGDSFDDSAALTASTTFSHVDKHYTYTLPQEPDQVVD